MPTLRILAADLGQLRRGDTIASIDGRKLTRPLTVSAPLADDRIGVQAPSGSVVEHWLYPDTQIGQQVAIERAEPKQAPERTMRLSGLKLVMVEPGYWTTLDGRYSISYDSAFTECDNAHPVRSGRGTGYRCPGGQTHEYDAWWVSDHDPNGTGEYTWDNPDACGEKIDNAPTLREAAASLAAHINS